MIPARKLPSGWYKSVPLGTNFLPVRGISCIKPTAPAGETTSRLNRLSRYATANNVDSKRWWLLTGPTSEINRLARTKYFAVMEAGQTWDEHSFIHTENVALIDGEGRVRGYYDGTNPDQIRLLIKHVGWLLEDYDE